MSKKVEINAKWRNRIADLFVVLTGIGLCSYIVLNGKCMLGFGGDNGLAYTACSLVSKALFNHELPLWNPYIWGGLSNVGSPVGQAFYPIHWLLSCIFYDTDAQVLSYAILPASRIVHLSIYFSGIYFLLKHLKLSFFSAFLTAILSTFCFTIIRFIAWVMFFEGCCWFPFLVLASIKVFETEGKKSVRCVGILGLLWALDALISVSHALIMSVFFCTILLIIYICRAERGKRLCMVLKFAGAGAIGVFLSLPSALSLVVFIKNCARYVPDVGWIYETSNIPFENFALKHVLTIQEMRNFWNVMPQWAFLSVSGLSMFLAILGIAAKKRHSHIFAWSVIGVVFTLFYGIGLVFPDLVYYLPLLNNNRENFMYMPFFNFFWMLLTAEGMLCIEKVLKENVSLKETLRYPQMAVCICVAVAVYNLLPHNCNTSFKFVYIIILLAILISLLAYGELLKNKGGNADRIGKLLKNVMILEFAICLAFSYHAFFLAFDEQTYTELDALQKIEKVNETTKNLIDKLGDSEKADFKIMVAGGSCYPENSGALFGIADTIGYYNPIPKMAARIHENLGFEKRSQLQNVRYFLASESNGEEFFPWFEAAYPNFQRRNEEYYAYASYDTDELSKVYVYDSKIALGEAWLVDNYELYTDEAEVLNKINSAEVDLGNMVFLNQSQLSDQAEKDLKNIVGGGIGGSTVECVERGINYMKFDVEAENSAILVTADAYYPGWKVRVNGKKSDILQVDYSNRGVFVPKGKSQIEFVYDPFEVRIGYLFQLFGMSFFLLAVFWPEKLVNYQVFFMKKERVSNAGKSYRKN